MRTAQSHLPPLAWHGLTPWYDRVAAIAMRRSFYFDPIVAMCVSSGARNILDLGSGTGALTAALMNADDRFNIVSFDADRAATLIGARAGNFRTACRGYAQSLPFRDCSFDAVVSSLMFHHLKTEGKREALRETHRVLRPGGVLHIGDLGPSRNLGMVAASMTVRLLDGFTSTRDNFAGRIPELMGACGFDNIAADPAISTAAGSVWHYRGEKRHSDRFSENRGIGIAE